MNSTNDTPPTNELASHKANPYHPYSPADLTDTTKKCGTFRVFSFDVVTKRIVPVTGWCKSPKCYKCGPRLLKAWRYQIQRLWRNEPVVYHVATPTCPEGRARIKQRVPRHRRRMRAADRSVEYLRITTTDGFDHVFANCDLGGASEPTTFDPLTGTEAVEMGRELLQYGRVGQKPRGSHEWNVPGDDDASGSRYLYLSYCSRDIENRAKDIFEEEALARGWGRYVGDEWLMADYVPFEEWRDVFVMAVQQAKREHAEAEGT